MADNRVLFGRRQIFTSYDVITKDNLLEVLRDSLQIHAINSADIDYLWRYMTGEQPILERTKVVRPEICNKVVENHASEITQFTSGYFMGEPCTYVRRGEKDGAAEDIAALNDCMFAEDKASHDKNMATWMAVCGVGYRMVLPDATTIDYEDESPFELDTPDPRYTFVVYHSGFGHHRMMGVQSIIRRINDLRTIVYCGYTRDHYFEVINGLIAQWKPHVLDDIPIFEYRLNMAMMGSFEPALPLLDAMNAVASNRMDGLEQFVQAFLKFINCDITSDDFEKLKDLGAIKVKSVDGQQADVDVVTNELNQEQTQTLVDYLYDQVLTICGMPTTTKGGASTSDTGAAVYLRDGWSQCEVRAQDTEALFKKSEKQFLRLVLQILRNTKGTVLRLSDIDCKFTRRQHDNLVSKSQALLQMLQAGLEPGVAIASSGLFNDPMDVAKQSEKYLEKWEPSASVEPTKPDGQSSNSTIETA